MAETKVKKTIKKQAESSSYLDIPVYDVSGKEVKRLDLSKELFDVTENKLLVAQYMRVYLVNQRQGTVATKGRSEVVGSTKKIYRQKGTGGARHGSRKAPIFVGGGVTFGPQPREFSLSFNKKQKKQALFASLTHKAKEGQVYGIVNEVMNLKPKTKDIVTFLKTVGIDKKKVLVIVPELTLNGLVLSSRNIPNVEFVQAANINPYMLHNHNATVFVEDALLVLEKHFLNHAN